MKSLTVVFVALILAGCSSNSNKSAASQPAASSSAASPAASPSGSPPAVTEEQMRAAGLTPEQISIMAEVDGKKWGTHEFTKPTDHKKSIIFSMEAQKGADGQSYGTLKLSCDQGGSAGIWVSLPTPENSNVRYAVDDAPLKGETWMESPKNDFLSPPSTKADKTIIAQLLKAKTFKFEFTPQGESAHLSTFNLLNLKELMTHSDLCRL